MSACMYVRVCRALFFCFFFYLSLWRASGTTWPAHGGGEWRRHEARAFRLNQPFFFFCSGLAAAEPNRSSLWVRSVSCQWFLFFSQKQRKWNNSFHPGDESRGRRGDFRVQQNRTQNSEPQLRIERDIYYISVFDSDVSSCVQAPNRQAAAGRRNTN